MRRRKSLIGSLQAFTELPAEALERLAHDCREEHQPAGATVMLEGHIGDRCAIIESGKAEVSILDAARKSVVVAILGAGEMFGETALLESGGHRNATVVALKPLHLLTIDGERFRQVLNDQASAHDYFGRLAQTIAIANFLKACTPFGALASGQLRELSQKLERISLPPGTTVVAQGTQGTSCYLVLTGKVEVILESEGSERRITTLGRGSLFGEAALLLEAPRNATVRSVEPTELLALSRAELLAALGSDPKVAMRLFELLQVRGRPRQAPGVEVHPRATADGSTIYYLKNPAQGTYYKLAQRGWFLWQQLDGRNGMRELVTAYFMEFKAFEPGVIAQTLGGLAMAGFLDGINLSIKSAMSMMRLKWWQRLLLLANRLIDWRWTLRGVDPAFQRAYDGGVRFLFSRAALAVLALLTTAGLAAFFFAAPQGKAAIASDPRLKWLILPAWLIGTALHECAHAFTTKYYGQQVNGVGIGWYRFGPVAFIDTSDMWLAEKWERIAVTAAGPLMNMILAGIASLLILVSSNRFVIAGLWQFAVLTYVLVLLNLNPLLELDGYYLLMDWLERPNLRTKALSWLRNELRPALKIPGALRAHRIELLYGIGTLIYVSLASVAMAISFHQYSKEWVSRWLPANMSEYFSYMVAILLFCFFAARIAGDLKGKQTGR